MGDDGGMGERRQCAALRFGDIGMEPCETADVDLVDQPTRSKAGSQRRERRGQGGDDRLGHQRRGIDFSFARARKARIIDIRPVDRDGMGVGQQLHRVEPVALALVIGAVGPETVARPFPQARHGRLEDICRSAFEGEAGDLDFPRIVEDAGPGGGGGFGPKREVDAVAGQGRSKSLRRRAHQVITSGVVRPVWRVTPAICSTAAIRSAMASPVSRPRSPPAGS